MLLKLKSIIDYLFPPRCYSCYELNVVVDGFCGECWTKFNFISRPYCVVCGTMFNICVLEDQVCAKCLTWQPHYDKSRSLMKFDEYSKHVVHAFKYYDKTNLAKTFSKLICNRYISEIKDVDVVIPVPMHKLKRLFRMYNHAHLLALEISKTINKPLCWNVLIKSKWTKSQTTLTKAQRLKNLAGSITLKLPEIIKNKKVLLVDDVKTTGATINKCSKILKQGGASEVYVVTIAMT